jgi:hypothetical protein
MIQGSFSFGILFKVLLCGFIEKVYLCTWNGKVETHMGMAEPNKP